MNRRCNTEPIDLRWPSACIICGRSMPMREFVTTCGPTCKDIARQKANVEDRTNRAIRRAGGKAGLDHLFSDLER